MRHKFFKTSVYFKMPMDPEPGDPAENGAGGGGSTPKDPEPEPAQPEEKKPLSFDDFLKESGNQAEFDRRVQRAIDTAVTKAQESWKVMTNDRVSEAEKLAKMTAAEKAQYQEQKRIKELDDREAAITRRELMATAKNTLADKGLPLELADILDYSSAEACSKSIEAAEKAISAGIEAGIKTRLQGTAPMKKAPAEDAKDAMKKQINDAVRKGFF